jgi:hypothetical protein
MLRTLTIILCSFLTLSVSAQEGASFPESWQGIYTGTLEIFGPQGLAQSLPMELHILPIEGSENHTWTIIYGEDKEAGARKYILEPTDPELGLFTVDEQNTIKIEGYLRDEMYIQVFTVMESQIIALTEKTPEGMVWEIIANNTTPVSTTGNAEHEGEEIPEVQTFPVTAYQRAHLTKSE